MSNFIVKARNFSHRIKAKHEEEEIGRTGLIQYAGYIDEEWLRELKGKRGVRNFREMTDMDSTIGASFYIMKSFLKQVKWTATPANDSEQALEWAQFLDGAVTDMQGTWSNFMGEVSTMMTFGWAAHEKVYKRRLGIQPRDSDIPSSRFNDGKIGWAKLAPRAQESLERWQYDDAEREVIGMWQEAAPSFIPTLIPIEKLILFRTEDDKGNPEGRSMLRNAFRSYFYLKRFQEMEGVGAERDATGMIVLEIPMIYLDENASPEKKQLVSDFKKLIQSIKRNQNEGIIIPSEMDEKNMPTGFKLRLLNSGGSRQFDFDKVIQRYQRNISQTLLTQFLFLGMDSVGSFALSSDQTNLFAHAMGALLKTIQDTFNRFAVAELMQVNGVPEDLWPTYEHGDLEQQNVGKFIEALEKAIGAGVLTPDAAIEAQVRTELGLEAAEEDFDPTERVVAIPKEDADGVDALMVGV